MQKIAVFIPARLNSHRLPYKHLLKIQGRECIAHLIDRVKLALLPNMIAVCTTENKEDGVLVDIAFREKVLAYQGNEYNILLRYINFARYSGVDFIVNVDGDDIFCDPFYIDKVIERYLRTNCDVVFTYGLPYGVNCFGFKRSALEYLVLNDKGGDTNWIKIFTEEESFKKEIIYPKKEHFNPGLRLTLDTPADYEMLSDIYTALEGNITLDNIIKYCEKVGVNK